MPSRIRRGIAALSLALLASGGGIPPAGAAARADRPGAAPRRVVSLNLCSDQLVLALADRSQIAGLTPNARDPAMSAEAARARGLPLLKGSAEEILATRPDLVVGLFLDQNAALAALKGHHAPYRTLDLPMADDYAHILASIRMVAAALGHRERGEALIARMNRDLAAVSKVRRRGGHAPVAAYYQRRGYLTGTGTLVDDLMQHVGLTNLAARLGKPVLSRLSLEEMVAARPDYLIVETATDRVRDQGTAMLHHPALAQIPRIRVAQAWTVCGGPAYVRAARAISEQANRR